MSQVTDEPEVIDPCTICHKPKADHPYRHRWAGYGSGSEALFQSTDPVPPPPDSPTNTREASQSQVRVMPNGDPILRMVLIRKGIITVDDLENIEAELKGAGVASFDPSSMG